MKLIIFSYLCLCIISSSQYVDTKNTTAAKFPTRSNIYFILDGEISWRTRPLKIFKEIMDGVPLTKYRIGVYTTCGYSSGVRIFYSTRWMIEALRDHNFKVNMTMIQALKEAKKDAAIFSEDKSIFVAVTDKTSNIVTKKFNSIIDMANPSKKSWQKFGWFQESLNKCSKEGEIIQDECKRECECVNGLMTDCYRVRLQYSVITLEERLYYINAYKELRYNPKFYSEFVRLHLIHADANRIDVHNSSNIQEFHRIYLLEFENLLRSIDCSITIPYWNFLLEGMQGLDPHPWYHIFDEVGGFGSINTTLDNGYCVTTGEFKYPDWTFPVEFQNDLLRLDMLGQICNQMIWPGNVTECNEFKKVYNPGCIIRRRVLTDDPTKKYHPTYERYLDAKDYVEFGKVMLPMHTPVHNEIAGLMSTGPASFDPIFFPVHTYIDAVYTWWQLLDPKRLDTHMHGDYRVVWYNVHRKLYADNSNLGGRGMKIKYTAIF